MHVLKHHQAAPGRRPPARIAWSAAILAVIVCLSAWTAWQRHAMPSAIAPAPAANDERSISRTDSSRAGPVAGRRSSGMTAAEFQRMYEGDSAASPPLGYGF